MIDLYEWAARSAKLYPQIIAIILVGSRAFGCARDDSDYDVVMVLDPGCYDASGVQLDHIEQCITFDPAVDQSLDHPLDLFFLVPGGRLHRWDYPADGEPNEMTFEAFMDLCDGCYAGLNLSEGQHRCIYLVYTGQLRQIFMTGQLSNRFTCGLLDSIPDGIMLFARPPV
jgi:predicted nucleotidyltransferase